MKAPCSSAAPLALKTRTATGPASAAWGVRPVKVVDETNCGWIRAWGPNRIVVWASNPMPVTTTEVPPPVGPRAGETWATSTAAW